VELVHTGGSHLYNPYPDFEPVDDAGRPLFMWPRGFPLEFIHAYSNTTVRGHHALVKRSQVQVFQSLADHNPDVDAIYRMSRTLPARFSRRAAVLAVPAGSFAPWNAQATLWRGGALWGSMLPITVTGRVSDIWRSYLVDRLLWEADSVVAFTSSFVTQYRNPHSYSADFAAESDLYGKSQRLLQVLSDWTSPRPHSMAVSFINLYEALHAAGIVGIDDVLLARAWVHDLHAMSFEWPAVITPQAPRALPLEPLVDERRNDLKCAGEGCITSAAQDQAKLHQQSPREAAKAAQPVGFGQVSTGAPAREEPRGAAIILTGQARAIGVTSAKGIGPGKLVNGLVMQGVPAHIFAVSKPEDNGLMDVILSNVSRVEGLAARDYQYTVELIPDFKYDVERLYRDTPWFSKGFHVSPDVTRNNGPPRRKDMDMVASHMLMQILDQKSGYQMALRHEERTGTRFKWFIRTRADLGFNTPIMQLADLQPSCVHVPRICGIFPNDKFAVISAQHAPSYFNRYDVFRLDPVTGKYLPPPPGGIHACPEHTGIAAGNREYHPFPCNASKPHDMPKKTTPPGSSNQLLQLSAPCDGLKRVTPPCSVDNCFPPSDMVPGGPFPNRWSVERLVAIAAFCSPAAVDCIVGHGTWRYCKVFTDGHQSCC